MESFDYDPQSIQKARDSARRGKTAAGRMAGYTSEQIDRISQNMVKAAEGHTACLAQMTVEEIGFGKALDRTYKNHAASTLLYNNIKEMSTVGIICEGKDKGTMDVAEPVGLIMDIVLSTSPTSTVIYKFVIAIKAGNAIAFSPHPSVAECILKAAELMSRAAEEAGAPEGMINCISMPTMSATNELMHYKEVFIIIAAGGPDIVKATYSTGKPAIGVGTGNPPVYIERTADVHHAVRTIIASKTFDSGIICASEQSIICEECNRDQVVAKLRTRGGYSMAKEGIEKVCSLLFKNDHNMNAKFMNRSPRMIAEEARIAALKGTEILIGEQGGMGEEYPLSCEKLTTVLAFHTIKDWKEACKLSMDLLQNGVGRIISLHIQGRGVILKFVTKPASRILMNTGGSQGGTGISTGLNVAFTLGCGTCGGSSVSENVNPMRLINIRKVAYGLKDCVTLMEDDGTFHPNTAVSVPAPVSTPRAPLTYSSRGGSMSPAVIMVAYETRDHAEKHTGNPAPSGAASACRNEKLTVLMRQLIAAMKNQQDA